MNTGRNETRSEFAEYLERLMQLRGWGNTEAAKRMEVDVSTVRKWRNGTRVPSTWYSRRIAEEFEVDEREVMIRAGHLDPIPLDEDPIRTKLHDLIDSIPAEELKPYISVFEHLAPLRKSDTE